MIDTSRLDPWGGGQARTQPINQPNPYGDSLGTLGGASAPIPGPWQGGMNPGGFGADVGGQVGPAGGGMGMDNSGFIYPSEWGQSAGMWGQYGQAKVPVPSSWQTGMQALTPMAQTGQPISADPWWQAMQKNTALQSQQAIQQAAEQAGLGGMRWSTPLGRSAQEIAGNYQNQAAQQWAEREMAAQEAARQRQLAATGQLFQYGQGQYGMSQDELARQAQAASAVGNMGSRKADLALDVINRMYGMGQGMQGAQQSALNNSYNNPYANMAMQYLGQQQQGMPQTYEPSWGSQIGGIANALLPYTMGGGGGGGYQTNPTATQGTDYWGGANPAQLPYGYY